MASKGKAVLFGFLIWLTAFLVAFLIFPLRESSRPLFESIMPVTVAAATVAFAVVYFRGVTSNHSKEGIVLGCLWFAISVVIDLPLFLFESPMQMTLSQYFGDIGLTYLIIPAITTGIGLACGKAAAEVDRT